MLVVAALLRHHVAQQLVVILLVGGQHAVAQHAVDGIVVEREIGLGAQRLLDDHLLRVDHQPIRADVGIGERRAQHGHLIVELLQRLQHVHTRQELPQQRLGGGQRDTTPAFEAVGVDQERLRHAQQAHRLAGRRGVDHDDVENALLRLAVDVQQRDDLVHAGNQRHLLGGHVAHPLILERGRQVLLHLAPVVAHLVQRVDLLRPQVRRDLTRLGGQRAYRARRPGYARGPC